MEGLFHKLPIPYSSFTMELKPCAVVNRRGTIKANNEQMNNSYYKIKTYMLVNNMTVAKVLGGGNTMVKHMCMCKNIVMTIGGTLMGMLIKLKIEIKAQCYLQ